MISSSSSILRLVFFEEDLDLQGLLFSVEIEFKGYLWCSQGRIKDASYSGSMLGLVLLVGIKSG